MRQIKNKMAKINYQLHLKGYVGGWDFDSDYVDFVLNKYKDQEVNVIIDSLGGRTDTALSIYAAFKRHGNVNVHFVGMNASAATIASMGAKHISIDSSAMYLVHKCSWEFFKWGLLNSEQMQTLIEQLTNKKEDLDKTDANVAAMYAKRCKKSPQDLLDLMKRGGWLTSKEALEWGFVDEITDYEDDSAPVLDESTISAMASVGMPMPKGYEKQKKSILKSIANFFGLDNDNSEDELADQESEVPAAQADEVSAEEENYQVANQDNSISNQMKKVFNFICALLTIEAFEFEENKATLTDEQLQTLENAIKADKDKIDDLTNKVTALEKEKATLTNKVAELSKKPAEESQQVVTGNKNNEKNDIEAFVETQNEAQKLFDMFS